MNNPWGRESLSPERAVLLALSVEAQAPPAIASKTGLREDQVLTALRTLLEESLAIREDGQYELTGPLCWFGTFDHALAHHARKRLLVTIDGEPESHLYVCDIRVKGARPVGDPQTETATVLGCGRTARNVSRAAPGESRPACADCARASARSA